MFSTPAEFGVTGSVDGRRVDERPAPACRRSPPGLARAERTLFATFMPQALRLERAREAAAYHGIAPIPSWELGGRCKCVQVRGRRLAPARSHASTSM
jgi:hypothetical protein